MSMNWTDYLDMAQKYANKMSGCNKVAVGSLIIRDQTPLVLGANRCIPDLCKTSRGCLRIEKYGEDSKNHRNPQDCRAVHSEIDAIAAAAACGISLAGTTIVVTRYPCEGCIKAIIRAGILQIIYGGTTPISSEGREMLESIGIKYQHVTDWKEDLSDR